MSTTESELAGTADLLGALVNQRRYGEAQACFNTYCRDLKEIVWRLPAGDPRLREMEAEWRRLLEQTRRQVLVGRAHAAARLARLPRPRRVYRAVPAPRRTWQILG
jgi:hypothetical protein